MRSIRTPKRRVTRLPVLERDIQRGIIQYLSLRGIPYAVTDASRAWGKDGTVRRSKVDKSWPDITAILPGGRCWLIEVKTPKGRLSVGQAVLHIALRRSGALVTVARCLEDVHAVLESIRRTT